MCLKFYLHDNLFGLKTASMSTSDRLKLCLCDVLFVHGHIVLGIEVI